MYSGKSPPKIFSPWPQSPDIGYWKKSGIELAVLLKESGELMEFMGLGVMPDEPGAWAWGWAVGVEKPWDICQDGICGPRKVLSPASWRNVVEGEYVLGVLARYGGCIGGWLLSPGPGNGLTGTT